MRAARASPGAAASLAALALAAGTAAAADPAPPPSPGNCRPLFVINNGFHSSLVAPADMAAAAGLPQSAAPWVEIGWGEARAYQAPKMTFGLAARTLLRPGPSTVFVRPLRDRPDRLWSDRVLEFGVSREGAASLTEDLRDELKRDEAGRLVQIGGKDEGLFYAASSNFRLWRMCNQWAAERLGRAGLDVGRGGLFTAGGLAKRLGRLPTCAEIEAQAVGQPPS